MERRHILLLIVIALVSILDGMDGSIVNVALPDMAKSFGTDTGTISWVTVAYFMAVAGTVLTFAKMAASGYVKEVLVSGIAVFGISSLVCGLSTDLFILIAARLVQGAGAAMMGCTCAVICVRYLPSTLLATGFGLISIGASVGYTIGPGVGGAIVGMLSWHWAFFINVPLCILVLAVVLKLIKSETDRSVKGMDILGGVLLFAFISFGIYALERWSYEDERLMVFASIILFFLFLVLFIVRERAYGSPLIHIRIFRNKAFLSTYSAYLLFNLSYMGLLYLIPFYMQVDLNISVVMSGIYLLIPSLICLVVTFPVSRRADMRGYRSYAVAGATIFTLGIFLWFPATMMASLALVLCALSLMGLSWAFCGSATASRPIEMVGDDDPEMASSLVYMSTYVGAAVGTALYALMFTSYTGSGHTDFKDMLPSVFLDGYQFCVVVTAILGILVVLLSAIVRNRRRVDDS